MEHFTKDDFKIDCQNKICYNGRPFVPSDYMVMEDKMQLLAGMCVLLISILFIFLYFICNSWRESHKKHHTEKLKKMESMRQSKDSLVNVEDPPPTYSSLEEPPSYNSSSVSFKECIV